MSKNWLNETDIGRSANDWQAAQNRAEEVKRERELVARAEATRIKKEQEEKKAEQDRIQKEAEVEKARQAAIFEKAREDAARTLAEQKAKIEREAEEKRAVQVAKEREERQKKQQEERREREKREEQEEKACIAQKMLEHEKQKREKEEQDALTRAITENDKRFYKNGGNCIDDDFTVNDQDGDFTVNYQLYPTQIDQGLDLIGIIPE